MLILTDIPDIMETKLGWHVAGACMRRWFRNGSAILSLDQKTGATPMNELPSNMLCTGLLTMEWALRFDRVRKAHDQLLQSGFSPKGLKLLGQRVTARAASDASTVGKGRKWRFGDLSQPAVTVSRTAQMNFLSVGGIWDPLDDFYGAVGRGTLELAASGMVENLDAGAFRIEIDAAGVYLRDTYDFVGDQNLGVWWSGGILGAVGEAFGAVGAYPHIAIERAPKDDQPGEWQAYSVSNADFGRYRTRFGHGGDYVNVSEVRTTKISPPRVVTL